VNILALDTATECCSVALLLEEQLLQHEQRLEHGHARAILPMVDELLGRAGVTLAALSAIAFGRGPGAFTGVRLAASITQGLAFGAGVPVVPVSDLRAVAQRALDAEDSIKRVLVCMDARMQEVYWGCFERADDGFARASCEERVTRPEQVQPPQPWAAGVLAGAGSGFAAYPQLRTQMRLDLVFESLVPRAAEIARLAVPEVAAGRFLPPEQALPVYLRDDVARARPAAS
jgi:tRNA threonylcarbamoyladenosine biosynthesis protein TsaB